MKTFKEHTCDLKVLEGKKFLYAIKSNPSYPTNYISFKADRCAK
jgi:hypothetical protein